VSGAVVSEARQKAATGSDDSNAQQVLLAQYMGALGPIEDLSAEEKQVHIASAFAILEGLGPRDELEGMLAAQMVAAHSAAMECMRQAMKPGQKLKKYELNLKHAEKLFTIYARQIEVLDKHRGRGTQKVVVEYVNVESGGQAVVGHVESGSKGRKLKRVKKSKTKTISQGANQPADREGELAPTAPLDSSNEGDQE